MKKTNFSSQSMKRKGSVTEHIVPFLRNEVSLLCSVLPYERTIFSFFEELMK